MNLTRAIRWISLGAALCLAPASARAAATISGLAVDLSVTAGSTITVSFNTSSTCPNDTYFAIAFSDNSISSFVDPGSNYFPYVWVYDDLRRYAPGFDTVPDFRGMDGSNPGGNGINANVTPLLQPLNVLVAEDNPVNAKVLKGMLEQLGHRPLLCGDGAAALEAYRRAPQRIDLVLMDYEMPVLDGLVATQRIRQFEAEQRLPRKPIFALTAHAFREQQEKCLAAGMDGYLSKPISLKLLGDTLRDYQYQLSQAQLQQLSNAPRNTNPHA